MLYEVITRTTMRKRGFRVGNLFVLSVVLVGILAWLPAASHAKTYRLKFQMAWHTQHPEYKAFQEFVKRVEKETDGQIKFTIFPASQLIGTNEALDGLKNGTIDMLAGCASYYP